MNIRNAAYNAYGTIDCELEHPVFGWIPFTASPDDVEVHGREIYAVLLSSGSVAPYIPPAPVEPYIPPTPVEPQPPVAAS